jgi:hypothetical protein
MDQLEFGQQFLQADRGAPGTVPVKVYVNGFLLDVTQVTIQASEDPDIEPTIVIHC